jgi:hypothetical protein
LYARRSRIIPDDSIAVSLALPKGAGERLAADALFGGIPQTDKLQRQLALQHMPSRASTVASDP